ncbi:serine hydrolase domain-containing protein [Oceanisphaera arctica]|uniref:6-aminohexanoate hydrolase n=1 Tax=Oceanisphaera arctica TaxID=641510 RepID=A0A2P5THW7_9GAMM|nr:serine hydrolase [Oceanisphaera arctica]PPL14156.1 6-aminohexanoate hydrolase [Oceanisphaera arctica]GHA26117.1 6-aminohexanoate-dimer hydrolase [Oceanisphaera arctica]
MHSSRILQRAGAGLFCTLLALPVVSEPLSAKDSDPAKLGWMQGFPPAPDKVIRAADGSFFQFPALRYSVTNMRQFMPTVEVSRGLGAPVRLKYRLDPLIDYLQFMPWGSTQPVSFEDALWLNYTDGLIILHRGEVVYERYLGALSESKKHAAMSVTKSFTGTLAAILVAEGTLDESKMVAEYIPELKDSAFGDATVRQLMDMTTGLQYSEDYADPNAEVWQYSAAGNPLPKPADYTGPVGYFAYLQQVKKQGEHGQAFGYKTVNSDALGWVISRVTGQSVAELLSQKIWRRIGMEQDAYYQVDELGIPFAGGGLSAGLRDMARFGELIRNRGKWQGEQIVPAAAVEDIRQGGSKEAFAKAGFDKLPGWSYRNMWWVTHNRNGAFAARGVHGQTIYIDPAAEMVLVRFASHPVAANGANDPTSLPAYQAVADHLISLESKRKNHEASRAVRPE